MNENTDGDESVNAKSFVRILGEGSKGTKAETVAKGPEKRETAHRLAACMETAYDKQRKNAENDCF